MREVEYQDVGILGNRLDIGYRINVFGQFDTRKISTQW